MRLPNLFLIGAMKSGTTTLAAHLVRSPDIAYFADKEPFIFNQDSLENVRTRLDALWKKDPETPWILDATPNYTRFPGDSTPDYIKALVTEPTRFIYLIRDPVERVVSHYFWNRELYGESLPFMKAVAHDPRYIDPSRYDVQIQRYTALFDPASFIFVKFETFVRQPEETVTELLAQLGAAPAEALNLDTRLASTNKAVTREARLPGLVTALRANRGVVEFAKSVIPPRYLQPIMQRLTKEVPRPEISEEEKTALREIHFLDTIDRTEALTGLDLSDWR